MAILKMGYLKPLVEFTFGGYEFYVVEGPFRNSVVNLIQYGGGTITETLDLRQDTIIISRGMRDVPEDIRPMVMEFRVLGIDFITDCLDKEFMIHPQGYILREDYESEYTPIFVSNFEKWFTDIWAERLEQNRAASERDGNTNNTRVEPEDLRNTRRKGNTINNFDEVPITLNQRTSVAKDYNGESTNQTSSNEIELEVIYISSDSDDEELITTKPGSVVDDNEENPVQLKKPPASLFINPNQGSKTQCAQQKKNPLSTAFERTKTHGTRSKTTDDIIVTSQKRITRDAVVESATKVVQDKSTTDSKDVSPKSRSKKEAKGQKSSDMDVTFPKRITRATEVESATKVVRDKSTTDSKDVMPSSKRKERHWTKSDGGCSPRKKTRSTGKSGPRLPVPEGPRNKSPSLISYSSTRPPSGHAAKGGEKTRGIVMSRSPVTVGLSDGPVVPAENDVEGWLPRPNNIDVVKLEDFCMPLVALKEPILDTTFTSSFDLVSALCPKCKNHTVYSQLNPLYVGSNGPGHCLRCAQKGIEIEMKFAFRLIMEVGYPNTRLEVSVIGRSGWQLLGCNEAQFLQDQSVRHRVLDTLRAAVSNETYIHSTTIVTKQKDYHCIFLTNPKFLKIGRGTTCL